MVKQVIVIRKDLNMRKGKIGSQAGHSAMMFLLLKNISVDPKELRVPLNDQEAEWVHGSFTKITACVNSEAELQQLIAQAKERGIACYPVMDNGKTEFHGVPTLTCASFGPDEVSKLDALTGHLPLL